MGAGDAIERFERDERRLTIADVVALYATHSANQPLLEMRATILRCPPPGASISESGCGNLMRNTRGCVPSTQHLSVRRSTVSIRLDDGYFLN